MRRLTEAESFCYQDTIEKICDFIDTKTDSHDFDEISYESVVNYYKQQIKEFEFMHYQRVLVVLSFLEYSLREPIFPPLVQTCVSIKEPAFLPDTTNITMKIDSFLDLTSDRLLHWLTDKVMYELNLRDNVHYNEIKEFDDSDRKKRLSELSEL